MGHVGRRTSRRRRRRSRRRAHSRATDNLDQSSGVQCVLDAYGPSPFNVDGRPDRTRKGDAAAARGWARRRRRPARRREWRRGGGRARRRPERRRPAGAAASSTTRRRRPNRGWWARQSRPCPTRSRAASPITYVAAGAPPFLIMHGLADNSVPYQQSDPVLRSARAADNKATMRLVDGLPHTFFNRTNLDELAGPFRMEVSASGSYAVRSARASNAPGVFRRRPRFLSATSSGRAGVAVKVTEPLKSPSARVRGRSGQRRLRVP